MKQFLFKGIDPRVYHFGAVIIIGNIGEGGMRASLPTVRSLDYQVPLMRGGWGCSSCGNESIAWSKCGYAMEIIESLRCSIALTAIGRRGLGRRGLAVLGPAWTAALVA